MERKVEGRIQILIDELSNIRLEISEHYMTDQQTKLAGRVMDPELLRELEATTEFIRRISLQCSIVRHSKPSSSIRDVVESLKLRNAVEELQKARASQRKQGDHGTSCENKASSFQNICRIADQVYQSVEG